MKMRLKWFVIPAVALSLGACKKETPPEKAEAPAAEQPGVVEKAVEKVKDAVAEVIPAKPAIAPEVRAEKLGFAKYLPKNVESLTSVYDAAKIADRAKALKLWKFIAAQAGSEAAAVEDAVEAAKIADPAAPVDPAAAPSIAEVVVPEEKPDPNAFSPKDMWGSEVTIALGDTGGGQIAHLLTLMERYNYFSMRQTIKTLVGQVKKGDAEGMAELENPFGGQLMKELLNDPEGGAALFEKMNMPPVYLAFKTEPAKREQAALQISTSLGLIGSFGELAEPLEVEKNGSKFAGYKVAGASLAKFAEENRATLEKEIEPDMVSRLLASLEQKNLVILTGTIGDYVVLFLGSSADQLVFAADAKDSLGASDALAFSGPFVGKELGAVMYGNKESLKLLTESVTGLSVTAKGIRDGLAGEKELGDTREIESLLQVVVDREAALRKLSRFSDTGAVAFFEEGLKIESFGGVDQGSIDWQASPKLAHLGDSPDVVLFADVTVDAAYQKISSEFIESVVETGYAMTRKVSELPPSENLAQIQQGVKLFEEKFRGDALGLWDAFSKDFHDGLGRESALVVDLKGALPSIPGVPQAVVDQGKIPRISVITPVVDRTKLASAWEKTNKSATNILAKISEISGRDIPMQKPLSSEKNGLTTWFFPMPFFNDDFLPSFTVGDQWFVASTSKTQALDLVDQAAKGAEGKKGLVLKLNFIALQSYSKEMLKVIDANADSLFGANLEAYRENKASIEKSITALDDFDSLTIRSNRDADYVRTSIHFKTR